MPNEIFIDMKDWLASGKIKSPQHQPFVYSYYWYVSYLWNSAKYAEVDITQSSIKETLGYNHRDKRLNYIIKEDGLLDEMGYTYCTRDYPIYWVPQENGETKPIMYSDYKGDIEEYLNLIVRHRNSPKVFYKKPIKVTENKNSHSISKEIFDICMKDNQLSRLGFYFYGVLLNIKNSNNPTISNDMLAEITGMTTAVVIRIKTRLFQLGLIQGLLSIGASEGEKKVFMFLNDSGLRFSSEYSFPDLKGIGDGLLRFDFAILDDNMNVRALVEFDGAHHSRDVDFTGTSDDKGKSYHLQTVAHDIAKNNYSKEKNIPLLRIPHWKIDEADEILEEFLIHNNLIKETVSLKRMLSKKRKKKEMIETL